VLTTCTSLCVVLDGLLDMWIAIPFCLLDVEFVNVRNYGRCLSVDHEVLFASARHQIVPLAFALDKGFAGVSIVRKEACGRMIKAMPQIVQ